MEKKIYYLNQKELPTIPVPHDCVVNDIVLSGNFIEFKFEDDISQYDSIQYHKPDAKSLIIRFHLKDDPEDYSVYQWVMPQKPFQKDGCYKRIENGKITEMTKGEYKLEYLYHNVGYCSIIVKLWAGSEIIFDADADFVEFEWIKG
ncbi:MAG: hypothetical protein K6G75_11325 [Lachnospiraceae bacterium]|nr:hypothetical protein [Lachnospiraceae bacterium]